MFIVDTVLFEMGMAIRPRSSVSVSSEGSLPHKFRSILASDLVGV
jgi:hypothetical protein